MAVEIKEVGSKKELKQFIRYPFKLYKGVHQFVPPLVSFEIGTLSREKNPSFDHCDARYWMAYKDGEVVGRIAGIVHHQEAKEKSMIRFGWIDFIDAHEVSAALINQVEKWGKEKGLTSIQGPMGFTDLDFQGALIDGFDQTMTQATLYNFPYYKEHFEYLGFGKAVDWVEYRKKMTDGAPMDTDKVKILCEKYAMSVKKFKNNKELLQYAPGIFNLLNETYSHLHGFYPLSQKQIDHFIEQYFGFVKRDFVIVIVDQNDQVIGFAITFPSLSRALQKAKGSLFPFGFIHLLKAFYSNTIADLFLIAAKDGYKNRGTNALIWTELYKSYEKFGIREVYTGQMLEENVNVLNLGLRFDDVFPGSQIRRRCFIKSI